MLKLDGYADNIDVLRNNIRMYYAPGEHNPPHIHGYYQDSTIVIGIHDCEIIEGYIPLRQLRLL